MSYYDPDSGAVPSNLTFVTFLSQRDVSGQTPVNYVNHPGVYLSAACFSDNLYLHNVTTKCFSNLLAVNFRTFIIDLYWDSSREEWSLCPVQLDTGVAANTSTATTRALQTLNSLSNVQIGGRSLAPTAAVLTQVDSINFLHARQASSTALASSDSTLSVSSVSTTTAGSSNTTTVSSIASTRPAANTTTSAQPVPTTSGPQEAIVQLGPYTCAHSANLDLLLDIIYDHLGATNTDVNATTVRLSLNIHAAALASNPTGSAPQPPSQLLPANSTLLGQIFNAAVNEVLYTPALLAAQRANLNAVRSWNQVDERYQPLTYYFTVVNETDGRALTPNGWPGEAYIELSQYKRLMVSFGNIDPQMATYDFSADLATIFPSDYTSSLKAVDVASNGRITDGCFFNAAQTTLSQINSSWAYDGLTRNTTTALNDDAAIYAQAKNLMDCGISPVLNTTLGGVTADKNYVPYQAYTLGSIWSWAPGQPENATTSDGDSCATMNSTTGNWQVAKCGAYYAGSCRVNNQPYEWKISSPATMYYKVDEACPDGTNFDVPRTALENTYLLSVFRQYLATNDNSNSALLWVDLNDLDIDTCWVSGYNTTCPYQTQAPDGQARTLFVPVIAGVIVLVLTILTILVKCAGARQNAKRRRRGDDGWDYEGIDGIPG